MAAGQRLGNSDGQSPEIIYYPMIAYDISEKNVVMRVMVQILKHKCLPILLYALEVCNLDKRALQWLDFTVNRFFS